MATACSRRLSCDYGQLSLVQLLCEKYQVEVREQDFQLQVQLILGISEKMITPFSAELREKSAGTLAIQPLEIGE